MEGLKYGVLGGTFDPPHNGHLALAREALGQLSLERVVFAPVRRPPHKPGNNITPIDARLDMLRLAIAENSRFTLSLVDVEREPPTYTVDTIRLLGKSWGPGVIIYFIMGMDSLASILTWHSPDQLVRSCTLAVFNRPGFQVDLDQLEHKLPGLTDRVVILSSPNLAVAASDIQHRVAQGQSIDGLVCPAVASYIAEHRLYRS